MKKKVSIVIPCYNEEESLPYLYNELIKIVNPLDTYAWEILFINDGSLDNTLSILEELRLKDDRCNYVDLSRNFGKEAAMLAGLDYLTGDCLIIIDADLQDPPEMLKTMYEDIKNEGYDCVALYTKSHKGYNFIRKGLTNMWYKFIDKISTSHQVPGARDFRLMTRQMLDAILAMPEYNRYTKGMFGFVGFDTKWIAYDAPERAAGTSKFNVRKLIKYAMEGIVAFSTSPLSIATRLGIFLCVVGVLGFIAVVVTSLIFKWAIVGIPALACLITFIGGLQLLAVGIMGIYIAKVYLEIKNRPIYIAKETEKSGK